MQKDNHYIDKKESSYIDTNFKIERVTEELCDFLQEKNKRYGNSALNPIGVFNKQDTITGLYVRTDDKISRIKNSQELRKNDVLDLMGYLTMICISKDWLDFTDQID